MDIKEKEFEAYVASITRLRWFILTTAILSSLVLAHMYEEQFSFQKQGLTNVISTRVEKHIPEKLGCLEEIVKSETYPPDAMPPKCQTVPDKYNEYLNHPKKELLQEYGDFKYGFTQTSHTLENLEMTERNLPLIGWTVPGNDFLPIMAIMLLIFCVGVWLNVRSVFAAITEIGSSKDPHMLRLAQLHFTFTGLLHIKQPDYVASFVRNVAFWLPPFTMLISLGLDVWPVLHKLVWPGPSEATYGDPRAILMRVVVLLVITIILFSSAQACTSIARTIDKVIRPHQVPLKPGLDETQ